MAMNWKHNIVDSATHASCTFGHNPILGLAISTMWGVVSGELSFTQQLITGTHPHPTPKNAIDRLKHQLIWGYKSIKKDWLLEID